MFVFGDLLVTSCRFFGLKVEDPESYMGTSARAPKDWLRQFLKPLVM